MEPYQQIVPDSAEPIMTLTLKGKIGRLPQADYSFVECYCTDVECDCRRVHICVLDGKGKEKARICFGFDPEEPQAGPFLDPGFPQATYAEDLLDIFVEMVNTEKDWLQGMHRRYKSVREKVSGSVYRGKGFPRPGTVVREAVPAPGSEWEDGAHAASPGEQEKQDPARKKDGSRSRKNQGPLSKAPSQGIAAFLQDYRRPTRWSLLQHQDLEERLRLYLVQKDDALEELAALLAEVSKRSPQDDQVIDAALTLLSQVLDILRGDQERERPRAKVMIEELQSALARHVFDGGSDANLCAAVSHAILQSRIEILPVLHEANARRMAYGIKVSGLHGVPDQEVLDGLCKSLEVMGVTSPFEGVEALLQSFALGNSDQQVDLTEKLLNADNPFIRDIAALMLFHPDPKVRLGVARLLAVCDGRKLTAETLRRLIVSRNWLPSSMRKSLDEAIVNARKARVECAQLPQNSPMTVHASSIDGAGAQSLQVIISKGRGYLSCSLLLKQGVGVADACVVSLKNPRELREFIAMMEQESFFLQTSQDYLDLRVCQALAEGTHEGSGSNFWLVHIAELLGKDQWRAVPFDPVRELDRLREELELEEPQLLTIPETQAALEDSARWPTAMSFADSWFEDDTALDHEIEASQKRKKQLDPPAAISRVLDAVLEKKRRVWLERLVHAAVWVKAAEKPPLPWHRLYHVARAVAEEAISLREIPLFPAMAEKSFGAYLGRREVR